MTMNEGMEDWGCELSSMLESLTAFINKPYELETEYGVDFDVVFSDSESDSFDGSDIEDEDSDEEPKNGGLYNHNWFEMKCRGFCQKSGTTYEGDLSQYLLAILRSGDSNHIVQEGLIEFMGYHDLDLVTEFITNRDQIVGSYSTPSKGLMDRRERDDALMIADREHKSRPLKLAAERENFPHIFRTNNTPSNGKMNCLPKGSKTLQEKLWAEVIIPAAETGAVEAGKLVRIIDSDLLCQKTFIGYETLNRMQSLVYRVAYETNENMLVCAPTGAGKTDAAMLTVLNCIANHCEFDPRKVANLKAINCNLQAFKIIYVAPMKALATEIANKFSKKLAWLGLEVREMTGDMQLSKQEMQKTQMIVTTPEKWDVVTRKSVVGDEEDSIGVVKLLILDEVHMLHDERGNVIESLVARTKRQVESTQRLIRVVGLSATLPNFQDVSEFLGVNPMVGLFYFDQSFRPVPLEQHFIGCKGKPGTLTSNYNLDRACFEKVKENLEQGHQVMVFVHSRKATKQIAEKLYQFATDENCTDLFDASGNSSYNQWKREMDRSKGRELRDLFRKGLGIHHAGMLRSDRNLIERTFEQGGIKVLCCTATLAWGVNLPAAAVIIRGTRVYVQEKFSQQDLGVLDVLQIFGRAGRPQYQQTGKGYIVTTDDKLTHYLQAVTHQVPIESRMTEKIVDNLNAEISLGTVTTISEAVSWLGYTYLYVRWRKNPLHYGITWEELENDRALIERRRGLIIRAAKELARLQMITYEEKSETLRPKDIGRIASDFYLLSQSIEVFNEMLTEKANEGDIFHMVSLCKEFESIQTREEELPELHKLKDPYNGLLPCKIPKPRSKKKQGPKTIGNDMENGKDELEDISSGMKINILLQAYISRAQIHDFTLVGDSKYIAQNAARICRALFHIALKRGWGGTSIIILSICKSIEKKIWSFQHPLAQFTDFHGNINIPGNIIMKLGEKESTTSIQSLRDMDAGEIGSLIGNHRMGANVKRAVEDFPNLDVHVDLVPLNREVLQMKVYLGANFCWNEKVHGFRQSYYIMAQNCDNNEIIHSENFILNRKKCNEMHELLFTIPVQDPLPSQIYVCAVNEYWLGDETIVPVSFQHLIRPDTETVYTELQNLRPLPITALDNPRLEAIYGAKFRYFNPLQTQLFHTLYKTSENVLLGSPTGSGKTVACELAMWRTFRENPRSKVVYIAPMKALVKERVKDWTAKITEQMGVRLVELTGDNSATRRQISDASIIITTPEKWDVVSRDWKNRNYVRQIALVIFDEIHLLNNDRGPTLEVIVSRMNYIAQKINSNMRIMGMSSTFSNPTDVANWLGARLYNFKNEVRPVPLYSYIEGFMRRGDFCTFMRSMNRRVFLAMKEHSPNKPVIVFVGSRRQCRLTAQDLMTYNSLDGKPRGYLNLAEDEMNEILRNVNDDSLRQTLLYGIGLHHAGLQQGDRNIVEELFLSNKIQVIVATSTIAWGVNLPAHLVIVKGTQIYDVKIGGYKDMDLTDISQMMGRSGRPQFDTEGIAMIFTDETKKSFYKHFIHKGFPIESSIHKELSNYLSYEINIGSIGCMDDVLEYLTWTYFIRRLHKNPQYYGLEIMPGENTEDAVNHYLLKLVTDSIAELELSKCVKSGPNGQLEGTEFGRISSSRDLSHLTIRNFHKLAKNDFSFADALKMVCTATEFAELPVRHNEDKVNEDLAKAVPLSVAPLNLPMWDPSVKAHLLIQARLTGVDLRGVNNDYDNDLNSVLDQVGRVIQGAKDFLGELGYNSSAQTLENLDQCIQQERWPADGP